jgi:N,N'-diacetyllegionaminate synthase
VKIGSVDLEKDVLVVAEIGNNHEGNFATAVHLVKAAAQTGVRAVKFQTFRTEHYVSRKDTARFARLKSFELTFDQFSDLRRLARSLGLLFLSTPFDLQSAAFLMDQVDAFKIASGDNDFYPLLECVAQTGKPILVSTGASDVAKVDSAVEYIRRSWAAVGTPWKLALLHCVSSYPTPLEQANLRAIRFLADRHGCTVGYSDHTLGIECACLAVAAGARIIEKHFTLDKGFSNFRDHQLSADPREMALLVERVRQVEAMLGTPAKAIQPCEQSVVPVIRRSIVANGDLRSGHSLAAVDLTWVRPSGGLPPGQEHLIIGRTLSRDVTAGEQLTPADVR